MGVAEKGGNALRKLKSAAQKRASSLPAGNLINAVVDQVNQFETGIKQTVDGVQDKVKGLQANLLKMYQANKELELENRDLSKAMVTLEKENAHLTMKLDRTQMELDVMKAKLENIGKLVSGFSEGIENLLMLPPAWLLIALFLIALLYDLVSCERQAGRLGGRARPRVRLPGLGFDLSRDPGRDRDAARLHRSRFARRPSGADFEPRVPAPAPDGFARIPG